MKVRDRRTQDPAFALFLYGCILTSTVVVRRTAFERSGGFRPQFRGVEDYDLWVRMTLGQGERFHLLPEVLSRYHRGPGALSTDTGRLHADALTLPREHIPLLVRFGGSCFGTVLKRCRSVQALAVRGHLDAGRRLRAAASLAAYPLVAAGMLAEAARASRSR